MMVDRWMELRSVSGMKSRSILWILLLLSIARTSQQQRSAQAGWLSIDCGALEPYEGANGISWVPDTGYVTGGVTANITYKFADSFIKTEDFKTLRYFPETRRSRFCYTLPIKKDQPYLLRWNVHYNQHDGKTSTSFLTGIDNFVLAPLELNSTFPTMIREAIIRRSVDIMYFCLYRTSSADNPFINSLELRPLEKYMYGEMEADSILLYQYRVYQGYNGREVFLRYPSDPYDRYWVKSPVSEFQFRLLNTTAVLVEPFYAKDMPPSDVMTTALVPRTSGIVQLNYRPSDFADNPFVVNLYLAELETLSANRTRIFDISINDAVIYPRVNLLGLSENKLYSAIEFTTSNVTVNANGSIFIKSAKATDSTEGPIFGPIEILSVHKLQSTTFISDATAIGKVKTSFGLSESWTGDPCLFFPYDWLNCSSTLSPRVTAVDLSNYNLTGSIPVGLKDLVNLTSLYLNDNKLTGSIPEWLVAMPNLQELYLQNNELSGNVPKALLSNNALRFRIDGNPRLCVNTNCVEERKSNVGVTVGAAVGGVVVLAVIAGILVYYLVCSKTRKRKGFKKTIPGEPGEEGTRGIKFSYAQVMTATKDNKMLLGRGGFGPVYYGKLETGQEVAVKISSKDSSQGSREFINEIELLTRIHHRNLVSLVGYCNEGENLILIYEYMPEGTLQEHLYGCGKEKTASHIDWPTRVNIALQAAQGLEYLHKGCSPAIFHRDVKSNNILLGRNMVAKVADFGLSKSTTSDESHISTMVKGTMGYLDPEYFSTNQLTDKSDVFSFGMVLLELICARPPVTEARLDQLVRPLLEAGQLDAIVDPELSRDYSEESMWRVAELAIQCVEPRGIHRPGTSDIVQELRDVLKTMENP